MLSGRSGRGGSRIRAPKKTTKDGEPDFEGSWRTLSSAFDSIHRKDASTLSFEELFRSAYRLVLKKLHNSLLERVLEYERRWLRESVKAQVASHITPILLVSAAGQSADAQANEKRLAGERFLQAFKNCYEDHALTAGMMVDTLMYLDKVCAAEGIALYPTFMKLFRDEVLYGRLDAEPNPTLLALLESVLLDQIQLERNGEVIDRSLIRGCCYMLESLFEASNEDETTKIYLTSFEPKFLQTSRDFYSAEGAAYVAEGDAASFCSQARKRLKEEDERAKQTISPITLDKIKTVVDQSFIASNITGVINMEGTGVKNMLDNDKLHDLANIYNLLARIDPKKAALREAVEKRIGDLGMEINKTAIAVRMTKPEPKSNNDKEKAPGEKPEKVVSQATQAAIGWVDQVLQLKQKYDNIWADGFSRDPTLQKGIEMAFASFINVDTRAAEYVSLFLDDNLKRGNKEKSEAEADEDLARGVLLLQYLSDKDQFEVFYRKHLARRLLMKKSVSLDNEKAVISKMRQQLGQSATGKIEGQLKDMELSEALTTEYHDYVSKLGAADDKRTDIAASILTTHSWPTEITVGRNQEVMPMILPPSVESAKQLYQRFYYNKHTGRKLTWCTHLGDADLRYTIRQPDGKSKRYEINVSTGTMAILLLFNETQVLTVPEIMAETNIPRDDVVKILQSLTMMPKWRLLKKAPMSKDVLDTDHISLNENFNSKFIKIKVLGVVNQGNKLETDVDRVETKKRIDEGRGHAVEAAIVRVMKQRKELTHQQLITETIQQLTARFPPEINMIKTRIDTLIEREYLERGPDASKPPYYVYLA